MAITTGAGPRARVIAPFRGARDGDVYPRQFVPGEEIAGDLARAMVAAGLAVPIGVEIETKEGGPQAGAPFPRFSAPAGGTGADAPSSSAPAGRRSGPRTSRPRPRPARSSS